MTDRAHGKRRSRYRSPSAEQSPDYSGKANIGLTDFGSSSPLSTAHTAIQTGRARGHSTRTKVQLDEHPRHDSPSWVDEDSTEPWKAKPGRSAMRGRKSSYSRSNESNSTSGADSRESTSSVLSDTAGFLPKLGRVFEKREFRDPRRPRASPENPTEDSVEARRRRPVEEGNTARPSVRHRQKQGSLRHRAEDPATLQNPSTTSLVTNLTNGSGGSSGSCSTVTQQSYDRSLKKDNRFAHEQPERVRNMDAHSNPLDKEGRNVFQYMSESIMSDQFLNGNPSEERRPTSSSSSSHETEGEGSSGQEEPEIGSPMTSPASLKGPYTNKGNFQVEALSSSPSSIVSEMGQRSAVDVHDDHDQTPQESEEGEEEETDNDNESVSQGSDGSEGDGGHHSALARAAPPSLPRSSSHHSDPHYRRLKDQEQELRNHVLQNPQPQRDFHFVGGPSPHPYPAMPLYESGSSPSEMYASVAAPVSHAAVWPPPAPPPPPIGYYSPPQMPPAPYPLMAENNHAMAVRDHVAVPNSAVQHLPYQPPYAQPPHYQARPTGPDLSKTTVVGYELVAEKLAERSEGKSSAEGGNTVVPMYRTFERLNHRVLLHLQDEISELEEELRYLDECIAQVNQGPNGAQVQPASRRTEARYGGELYYRRTDLLGRIYLKLGQYNQALSSFSTMLKELDAANAEDIQRYRSWLEKHNPVDHAEARFVEGKSDLLTIPRRGSASHVGGVVPRQSPAIWLPLMLVLPLMAFALIPGLFGRLFIVVLIGGAQMAMVSCSEEVMSLMTTREWVTCALIYFGIMSTLAGTVR